MIIEKINETRELLLDICPDNTLSHHIDSAGFLLRFYEFNNEVRFDDLVEEQLEGLTDYQRQSLYRYNYKINGHKSDVYEYTDNLIVLEIPEGDMAVNIRDSLKGIISKLRKDKENIIMFYFDGYSEPVYSEELVEYCEMFKRGAGVNRIRFITLDLYREVTNKVYTVRKYKDESITYTDVVKVGLPESSFNQQIMDHYINTFNQLNQVYEGSNGHQTYYIDRDKSDDFTELDWVVVAYLGLITRSKILFEDSSKDTKYSEKITKLFSQEWNSYSVRSKHISNLKGKSYIIKNRDGNYTQCKVTGVKEEHYIRCAKFNYMLSDTDVNILRHVMEFEMVRVTSDNILDSADMLSKIHAIVGHDTERLLKMMRKIQLTCMYNLSNSLVGWNDICWVLSRNNEILFGVPERSKEEIQVKIVVGNSIIPSKLYNSDLIPSAVFTDKFSKYKIVDPGEVDTEPIDADTLINLSKDSMKGRDSYADYIEKRLYQTALQTMGYHITNRERELYSIYMEYLGTHIIDKLPIDMSGRLDTSIHFGSVF